ncbi:MAG: urease accessory protein UreE [Ginsengibacter sp.]
MSNLLSTGLNMDEVILEWYEADKRILNKVSKSGRDISMKFLQGNPNLREGDILYRDNEQVIVVKMNPCSCIVISPDSILTASAVCYEVGNKHLPLFYEEGDLLVPYENPLYNLLQSSGYAVRIEERKLQHRIKTTVMPHIQLAAGELIFNKNKGLPS